MANDHQPGMASEGGLVTVSNWNACYNSGEDIISLSCTVTAINSSATISGGGLILSNSQGKTLCSSYNEFSGTESANLALNLPSNGLGVGDTVSGVVSGEVGKEHYFFNNSSLSVAVSTSTVTLHAREANSRKSKSSQITMSICALPAPATQYHGAPC